MNQKGVTLFLTIIILSIILAIVFGLSAILISQIRTIQKMGDSVVSFYAADAGTEQALKPVLAYVKAEMELEDSGTFGDITNVITTDNIIDLGDGETATYDIDIVCCKKSVHPDCLFGVPDLRTCNDLILQDRKNSCQATFFCIKSLGKYRGTQRAIETSVFPPN